MHEVQFRQDLKVRKSRIKVRSSCSLFSKVIKVDSEGFIVKQFTHSTTRDNGTSDAFQRNVARCIYSSTTFTAYVLLVHMPEKNLQNTWSLHY